MLIARTELMKRFSRLDLKNLHHSYWTWKTYCDLVQEAKVSSAQDPMKMVEATAFIFFQWCNPSHTVYTCDELKGKQPQERRPTHKCAGIRPFGNGEAAAFLVGALVKHLVTVTLVFNIAWTAAARIGWLRIKLEYLHSRTNTLPLTVEMT